MTDIPFSDEEFEALFIAILPDLQRISRQTRGEYTVGDLKSEAWMMALKLQKKGTAAAILSPKFQYHIIASLYNRLCKYANKVVRYATRFEEADDDEESGRKSWLEGLASSQEDDPALQLSRMEDMQEQENKLKASYSEAAVYLRLLEKFKSSRDAVAEHFSSSWESVRSKIKRARDWVQRQRSLFDGVEVIDENFTPLPNRLMHQKPLSQEERATLEHQGRLMQKKLFPRMYVPIRVSEN